MVVRKRKIKTGEPLVESPVIFFLKILNAATLVDPVENSTFFTDLSSPKHTEGTFNKETLKMVLDKVKVEQYSPQTACFWCCHLFDNPSVPLPISYDAYKNIYTAQGNFCSPECALAHNYSDITISDATRWNRHSLLGHLYSDLYSSDSLSVAPPRSLLRLFGGPLDIQQYREFLRDTNDIVLSEVSPIRLVFPTMSVHNPLRDVKKFVSLSSEIVEKASEQLRLKRKNPVNTNIQTLDKCIQR
jgi:hypothetical protein